MTFEGIKEPQRKLFYIAANISQSVEVKQRILDCPGLRDQLFEISKTLTTEVEILKIERDIDSKVRTTSEVAAQILYPGTDPDSSGRTGGGRGIARAAKLKEQIQKSGCRPRCLPRPMRSSPSSRRPRPCRQNSR